LIGVAY